MPYNDNPAGRLHDLLVKLAQQKRNHSVLAGWAAVLRVEPEDVVVHLGRVADLVRQIQDAVDRSGEQALLPPVQRYRDSWARSIFPQDQALNRSLEHVLPDAAAIEALDLVSAQLHSIAPEGVMPDEDELGRLKAQLHELIDGVRAADDMPDEVKHLVISRLRAVEEAVEHLDIGGPSAVRHATEAVMGSVLFARDTRLAESPTIQKMWTTLLILWTAFAAGPTIQASIEAWHEMIPLPRGGAEHSTDVSVPVSDGHKEDSP